MSESKFTDLCVSAVLISVVAAIVGLQRGCVDYEIRNAALRPAMAAACSKACGPNAVKDTGDVCRCKVSEQ